MTPTFKNEFTIGDLIQASALLIAAAGLVLTAVQTRRSNSQRRVEDVLRLERELFDRAALEEAYYLVEYGNFTYDEAFHGSELEKSIDSLLRGFDKIAILLEKGAITLDEVSLVTYHYLVLYQDSEIQKYFAFLDQWYPRRGIEEKPFGAFRRVGSILEKSKFRNFRALTPGRGWQRGA